MDTDTTSTLGHLMRCADPLFTSEHTDVFDGNLHEGKTEGGNAGFHDYEVRDKEGNVLCSIHLQQDPVKEVGVNGVFLPDLLQIVHSQLSDFQSGKYACRENAIALTKIEEAVMWLRKRTEDRRARQVLGTSKK